MIKSLLFSLIVICLNACIKNNKPIIERFNGISFVAPPVKIDSLPIITLIEETGSNSLAIMPFAFCYGNSNPSLYFNHEKQWWGEKSEGVISTIRMAKFQNQKVLLKPQIWIKQGEYTGDLNFKSAAEWSKFESDYQNFVLSFATIAAQEKVDIFCIGTELQNFINKRPAYWEQLIQSIKKIYKGKLTYAANWDEYQNTPFWNQLDYIGIDAYFPASTERQPSIEELMNGMKVTQSKLKTFSARYKLPILFTEYGYRSMNYAAHKPWESSSEKGINLKVQSNALSAFYETFWSEDYVAGGFLWKWFYNNEKAGGIENSGFTPQNKPAISVIKQYYRE